jgi:hypothetical protein
MQSEKQRKELFLIAFNFDFGNGRHLQFKIVSVHHLSVQLYNCLAVYLVAFLYTHPTVFSSIQLFFCPTVCPSVQLSVCTSVQLSVCTSVQRSVCPSVQVSTCLSDYPSVYLLYVHLFNCISDHLTFFPFTYLSVHLYNYRHVHLTDFPFGCLFISPTVYQSVCPSVQPSIHLTVFLPSWLFYTYLSVHLCNYHFIHMTFFPSFLSAHQSNSILVCLTVFPSKHLHACLFNCIAINLTVLYPPVWLLNCLPIHLSSHPSDCLSIHLSLCPSV